MKTIFNKTHWQRLAWMLIFMVGVCTAYAQDDYNPENPPEPETPPEPKVECKVTLSVSPADAGNASGTGTYVEGTRVNVRTSGNRGFVFKHWLKDGEIYSSARSFYYTLEKSDVAFEAVYEYAPTLPAEPDDIYVEKVPSYPLWLTSNPGDACSFNRTSGQVAEAGKSVYLRAYPSQNFVFQGWYAANDSLVSANADFNYVMPRAETTLTARYVYNPTDPSDPAGGGQTDVDNEVEGDVNGDGVVNTADAMLAIDMYLGNSALDISRADLNGDGLVDTADAMEIIDIYLNK